MTSKTGLHAIRALTFLAMQKEGTYMGAAAIADEINAPRNYLGKLMQTLTQSGILLSLKGYGGGYALSRSPKEISLFDVIDAIEGLGGEPDCFFGWKQCCDANPCAIHDRWKHIKAAFYQMLRDVSIENLKSGTIFEEHMNNPFLGSST